MAPPIVHAHGLPAALALALAAGPLSAQAPGATGSPPIDSTPPGRLVDLGGYRLHLHCSGQGSPGRPTVVLSAGAGDFAVDWGLVQPAVADSARVCSYDRAGDGWSDAGPEPRTLVQEAAELRTLLERAGERPPYLLVGHSLGGLVVRVFQERDPQGVDGMVLVDPTHEDARMGYRGGLVRLRDLATGRPIPAPHSLDQSPPRRAAGADLEACRSEARAAVVDGPFAKLPPPDRARRLWALRHPACLVDQEDYLPDEMAAIHARLRDRPRSLGDLPLVVVAAVPRGAPPGVPLEEWQREKADLMDDLARLSSRGRVVTVGEGGHWPQLDAPRAVIRAILDVMREATAP